MGPAFAVAAAAAWLAAAAKARAYPGRSAATDRKVLICYFGLLATSLALSAAESARLAQDFFLVTLIIQLLIIAVLVCQLTLLILWSRPPEWRRLRRTCVTGGAVVAIAMVILASSGAYAGYLLFYFAVFTAANGALLIYCLACSLWVRSGELRLGLLVAACGAACFLCYASYGWLAVARGHVGWPAIEPGQARLWWALAGAVFNLVGWSIPAGGARLGHWRARLAAFRAFRRLHPLWEALVLAVPGVMLDETARTRRDLLAVGDLDFWLHRRLVEIRDARLLMQRYFDERTGGRAASAGRASGLTGIRLAATVEAAQLTRAISLVGGRGPADATCPGTAAGAPDGVCADASCEAGVDELTWLTEVARAFSVLHGRKAS